jgi:HEAT repeat protein
MDNKDPKHSMSNFDDLSIKLRDKDWKVRQKAREEFEKAGNDATKYLTKILGEGKIDARWEAAKALITIKDPGSAEALVSAFKDDSFEITWLAAEALIALGDKGIGAILKALIDRPESLAIRQGAHHVLSDLERHGLLSEANIKVLNDLRATNPWEDIIFPAEEALENLKSEQNQA